jgi:hypothetical protein
MMIEVDWAIAAHAQDSPALGLSRFYTPERRRTGWALGRHQEAGREAPLRQRTTGKALAMVGRSPLGVHRSPSLWCGSACSEAEEALASAFELLQVAPKSVYGLLF